MRGFKFWSALLLYWISYFIIDTPIFFQSYEFSPALYPWPTFSFFVSCCNTTLFLYLLLIMKKGIKFVESVYVFWIFTLLSCFANSSKWFHTWPCLMASRFWIRLDKMPSHLVLQTLNCCCLDYDIECKIIE